MSVVLLIIFSNTVNALSVSIGDTYNYDSTTYTDRVGFVNYNFDANILSPGTNANMVCYNWDYYGGTNDGSPLLGFDNCYYTSTSARDACRACWSVPSNMNINWMGQLSPINSKVSGRICDGCDYDTSSRFSDYIYARVYYNCSSCSSSTYGDAYNNYYVIQPREYYCQNNADDVYLLLGQYLDRYDSTLYWVNYKTFSCSSLYGTEYGCDTDNDQILDSTGTTFLSDPCAVKDGYPCSDNADCISDVCAGDYTDKYRSHCTATNSYEKQIQDHFKCCSNGCVEPWALLYGPYYCSSGYECDYAGDDVEYTNQGSLPALCKRQDGYSCTLNSECLTNHYCVHGTCRSTSYYCGDGYCDTGETWCEADGCNPCTSSQCVSYYWSSCHNHDTVCCPGDTIPNQYHCNNDNSWSECSASVHTGCQQAGSYYCTYQGGSWAWRQCSAGCQGNACISCRDYDSSGFVNSEDTKQAIKIYFDLPGKITGWTVTKAEMLDCINRFP